MKKLSTQDILDMDIKDIEKLSRADIARMVSQVASAGNKRIANLQKNKLTSEALIGVYSSGGKFSVKGKNTTQLLNELKREKQFFSGSSTVSEVKAETKTIIERMEESGVLGTDRTLSDEDVVKEFWKTMDMLRETNPALFVNDCLLYGDDVFREITQGKTADETRQEIQERIDEQSKSRAEETKRNKMEWDNKSGWSI